MSTFFPPPPPFIGGAQPWAPPPLSPAIETESVWIPVHPSRTQQFASQTATWFTPPYPPYQQPSPVAVVAFNTGDNPQFGWYAEYVAAQTAAAFGWQTAQPPVQQSRSLLVIPGPAVQPPAPAPIPLPPIVPSIFPHDEYDDGLYSYRKTQKEQQQARLRQARIDLGIIKEEVKTEATVIKEKLRDPNISINAIAQQLSRHYYARYQTALRQAQAKADLDRETNRRRQDYLLSSKERTQREETGRRLLMKKIIEDDDAQVMELLSKLL